MKALSKISLFLSFIVFGCLPDVDNNNQDKEIMNFLNENNIQAQSDENGIYYYPIKENPGGNAPVFNDVVAIYYEIQLLDGSVVDKLDSTMGNPLKARHGVGLFVPAGMDIGISYMKEGEIFGLVIPSSQAYQGFFVEGLIPSNAIIHVFVELVDIIDFDNLRAIEDEMIANYIQQKGVTGFEIVEKGLRKRLITEGFGDQFPGDDQSVSLDLVGKTLSGSIFDERNGVIIEVGNNNEVEGLNIALRTMKTGEKAEFIIPSDIGYLNSPLVLPEILSPIPVPPITIMVYEIERKF